MPSRADGSTSTSKTKGIESIRSASALDTSETDATRTAFAPMACDISTELGHSISDGAGSNPACFRWCHSMRVGTVIHDDDDQVKTLSHCGPEFIATHRPPVIAYHE